VNVRRSIESHASNWPVLRWQFCRGFLERLYSSTILQLVSTIFCSLSFLFYGFAALTSQRLKLEFLRYGLGPFRVLVGVLQLTGGLGIIAGLYLPWLGVVAAGGLALLMALGLAVRIRIHDSLVQAFPAAIYMVLSLYLTIMFLRA